MKMINDILQHIAYSIANNEYVWTDQEKVAIKDNSHVASGWSDLFISANAFLNTRGGAIVIGIEDDEDNNRYIFKGFDQRNESKLRQLVAEFTDVNGIPVDVSEYIRFEVLPFMEGEVVAVFIDALPDDSKYIFYKNAAYERLVSGDHKIPGKSTTLPEEVFITEVLPEPEPEIIVEEPPVEEEPAAPEVKEEEAASFQKLFSGELITIFGSDYISLEPDMKQMLAFIYERNNYSDNKYPNADEISNKLWAIKGAVANLVEQELHKKKIKKVLFMMEKSDMIIRIKAQYRINTTYEVVKNLFN